MDGSFDRNTARAPAPRALPDDLCGAVCAELDRIAPDFAAAARGAHLLLQHHFQVHEVCSSHGIEHAYRVLLHTARALVAHSAIPADERLAVFWAALLHDADDRKFFPKNANNENAHDLMRRLLVAPPVAAQAGALINLVSASKNGDARPEDAAARPWILYPRYADRLEGLGHIGVARCWEYSQTLRRPAWDAQTPRPSTEEEVWAIASPERFSEYKGASATMIDHFYDKLLPMSRAAAGNPYLDGEFALRRQPLVAICLALGRGALDELLERSRAESLAEFWRGAL